MDAPDWLVDFLGGISLWDAILILAGIVAVILFVKNKGWRTVLALARGIINFAQVLEAVQGLPAFIHRTDERLAAHTKQLENSHDTNLRDDITEAVALAREARDGVEGVHGRLDGLQRSVDELARADDEIWAELDRTQPPEEEP